MIRLDALSNTTIGNNVSASWYRFTLDECAQIVEITNKRNVVVSKYVAVDTETGETLAEFKGNEV